MFVKLYKHIFMNQAVKCIEQSCDNEIQVCTNDVHVVQNGHSQREHTSYTNVQ